MDLAHFGTNINIINQNGHVQGPEHIYTRVLEFEVYMAGLQVVIVCLVVFFQPLAIDLLQIKGSCIQPGCCDEWLNSEWTGRLRFQHNSDLQAYR